ncbi:MAG TPA: hypothetical protein VNB94_00535 [Mycobacteriales bacterium]|nr:hypothetical protein [Mycobacteriales bacterium]
MPSDSTQPQPHRPSSPRGRAVRRLAGGIAISVGFAVLAPAIGNAAGVEIANPVAAALRGSVQAVSGAFEAAPAGANPSARPSATAAPTPKASRAESRGSLVSRVAACSPRGKDPLFAKTGAATNHGHFVRAAAHADTLALPFGSFDLSTAAGVESLCAALDAQRASLPSPSAEPRRGAQDDDEKGRGAEQGDREEPKARATKSSDRRTGKPTSRPTASSERRAKPSEEPRNERSAKPSPEPSGKPSDDQPADG